MNGKRDRGKVSLSFFVSPSFLFMTKNYTNSPKTSSVTFFSFFYIYTYIGNKKFLVQQKKDGYYWMNNNPCPRCCLSGGIQSNSRSYHFDEDAKNIEV